MARTIINLPLRNSVDESYNTAVNILQANCMQFTQKLRITFVLHFVLRNVIIESMKLHI